MKGLLSNLKAAVPHCANALTAALLAPACAVCDALLDDSLSGCVCRNCWSEVRPITPPVCDRCGDPMPRSDQRCPNCSSGSPAVTRARTVGEYEGALREIIHALKYSGRLSLARLLAERMRDRGRDLLEEVDGVVPVPLHWRREYQRGFNQAREIARHLGWPVVDALRRCRATRPQIELAADRRRANVAGAFAIRRTGVSGSAVRGRRLILVDDVSTTGATLESCARVLKDFGASEVFALTAARVVTPRS
jgi:ComF family protein